MEKVSTKERSRRQLDLRDRVVVITGGAGLLGEKHAEAVAEAGGHPVLADVDEARAMAIAERITQRFDRVALGIQTDVTELESVELLLEQTLHRFNRVDALVNNAANDPKVSVGEPSESQWCRLERFPLSVWVADLTVGLTGAFLCSRVIGSKMAAQGDGVILNVASDLSIIAPDQRIYRKEGLSDDAQPVKPVTYSVVKTGLIGLTRYLATYWAANGVRVNAISPGGVYAGQSAEFVAQVTSRIPLNRMAQPDEYKAAVVFLLSDASSYMTGANLVIDGGRSCW